MPETEADEFPITEDNLNKLLDEAQADRQVKKAFLGMPREEQLLALLGMIAHTEKQIKILNSKITGLQNNLLDYRNQREKQERKRGDDLENTGEKIAAGIRKALEEEKAKEFDFWIYLRDKVFPGILQLIILGILALVFAKQANP